MKITQYKFTSEIRIEFFSRLFYCFTIEHSFLLFSLVGSLSTPIKSSSVYFYVFSITSIFSSFARSAQLCFFCSEFINLATASFSADIMS